MSNKVYDILNKIQRWLPLVGALYLGLSKIWGFPLADEINQTIVVVGTFLAGVLEVSTVQYEKTKNVFDTGIGEE